MDRFLRFSLEDLAVLREFWPSCVDESHGALVQEGCYHFEPGSVEEEQGMEGMAVSREMRENGLDAF